MITSGIINYQSIFNHYQTDDGKTFFVPTEQIVFPEDTSLIIYDTMYIDTDTPWTILSWKIYGSIDLWWILCSLNRDNSYFYAKQGTTVRFIREQFIDEVMKQLRMEVQNG